MDRVGAPSKRPEELERPGRTIREARIEMEMTTAEMGDMLNYDASHIRNVELGRTRCARSFIERCRAAAHDMVDEAKADVLVELFRALDAERKERESAEIDVRRGTVRKVSEARRVRGDSSQLAGEWFALWQTSHRREELEVLELVDIKPTNARRGLFEAVNRKLDEPEPAPPAPGGGTALTQLLWEGGGRLFRPWVSGHFASASNGPHVAGVFHLEVDDYYQTMTGIWLGVSRDAENSHDSKNVYARLVMGRDEERARILFAAERELRPVPSIVPEHHSCRNAADDQKWSQDAY